MDSRRVGVLCWVAAFGVAACGEDDKVDPGRIAVIDTRVLPDRINAGGTATVECAGVNGFGEAVPGVTFGVETHPTAGVSLNGMQLTSTTSGVIQIICTAPGIFDTTPALLTVAPGPTVATTIAVDPGQITAGETASVTCSAVDEYGNVNGQPTYVAVSPEGDVTATDTTVGGTVAGEYVLSCVANGVAESDYGTTTLTINADAMVDMALAYSPNLPSYPVEKNVEISGVGLDRFSNVLDETFPVTNIRATPDGHHRVVGTEANKIRFDAEGIYTVTADKADDPSVSASAPLVIDATPPELTLTSPARAIVTDTDTTVLFEGTVSDNLGTVAKLTIGPHVVELPPAGGAFSVAIPIGYGLNLFPVVAEDPYGNKNIQQRTIERSTAFIPMLKRTLAVDGVDNALVAMITQEAIDDGDRSDMDDLGTIFHRIITGLDLTTLVPNPLTSFSCISGDCQFVFQSLTMKDTTVSIRLQNGTLRMTVELLDVTGTLAFIAPQVTIPAALTIGRISLSTDISIRIVDNVTVTEALNTVITVHDINFTNEGEGTDFEDLLNIGLDYIEQPLIDAVEAVVVDLVENELAGLLGSLFDFLALDQTFEVPGFGGNAPNTLVLQTFPHGVDISQQRLQLRLDAVAYAQTPARPYAHPGSIAQVGCRPNSALTWPPASPIVVGLHDDIINQLLFGLWEGGTINLELGPDATDELVADFGITDMTLKVDARLPPVFNSCGDLGERVQIGGLLLDADFKFGPSPMKFVLWLQTEATLDLVAEENEAGGLTLKIELGDLDPMNIEIVTNEGLFAEDDSALVDLLKNVMVPQLLGSLDDTLSFDLPTIDLHAMTAIIPEGTIINLDIQQVIRDNAYLTVQGALK